MTAFLRFEQFWKLPHGLLQERMLPDGEHLCKLVQAQKKDRAQSRVLVGENSVFCAPNQSTAHDATPLVELCDLQSRAIVGAITKTRDGSLHLPFELDAAIEAFQLELYAQSSGANHFLQTARRIYYSLRPLIPRELQIAFRRSIVTLQETSRFPRWPLDTSLDELYRLVMRLILETSGLDSIPFIWFWPQGYSHAVCLTHDVETQFGHDHLDPIINLESKYAVRSLWNFVPERYQVSRQLLNDLQAVGFEIGVHGLVHDGHLFDSYDIFTRRAEKINRYVREWKSVGFRAPSAIRNLKWIARHLEVEYDTSCPTVEIYAPQPGGCCSVFPYLVDELVELPFTLPQDHTLFTILKQSDEHIWLEGASQIIARNGLVNIIVHPDYTQSARDVARYEKLVQFLQTSHTTWFALPREVARWWKNRTQQQLVFEQGKWHVVGPDAERSRIAYVSLNDSNLTWHF